MHTRSSGSQRPLVIPSTAAPAPQGMRVRAEGPQLLSELVRKELGLDCSVLMGANIAEDIAARQLSEATIGYSVRANAEVFKASRRGRCRGRQGAGWEPGTAAGGQDLGRGGIGGIACRLRQVI